MSRPSTVVILLLALTVTTWAVHGVPPAPLALDEFADASSGWISFTDASASFRYTEEATYEIHLIEADQCRVSWAPLALPAGYCAEIRLRTVAGNGMAGVAVGSDDDNFLLLRIHRDQWFVVDQLVDGVWQEERIASDYEGVLESGSSWNTVSARHEDGVVTFWANGIRLATLEADYGDYWLFGASASADADGAMTLCSFDAFCACTSGNGCSTAPALAEAFADAESSAIEEREATDSSVFSSWIDGGMYHVSSRAVDSSYYSRFMAYQPEAFQDFLLTTEVIYLEGDESLTASGVVFRFVDPDNFYRFVVGADGTYAVHKRLASEWHTLVDWSDSNAVRTGSSWNKLSVLATGPLLKLYINDVLVESIVDDAFREGHVGLIMVSYADNFDAHAAFDYLIVDEGQ